MRVSSTLQERLADMRPSEAAVARRLLRNLRCVAEQSLRAVASACGTSDTTVVRTCRAAGFDGFQDLKYHVLREYTAGATPHAPGPDQPAYQADLAASRAAAERHLDAAARLVRRARRMALVGIGASSGIALVARDILFTQGKQALVIGSEQDASFAFTPPTGGLVLLAISHSGETQFVVETVRQARQGGVPTIGLTNEPASDLGRAVQMLLPTQAVEPPHGSYAIGPRICQLAVLDLLLARAARPARPAKRTARA
jgi:DNA-binding MurR/RpiR family transcriptional regulator